MSATQHKMPAIWVQDADMGAELEVEITFTYLPGSAPRMWGHDGGDPGYSAEVEFISAKRVGATNYEDALMQGAINDWAQNYIDNEGYAEACSIGEDYLARGRDDY